MDASVSIGGATKLQQVDIDISTLALHDELGVPRRRWTGSAVVARAAPAIVSERRHAMLPRLIEARQRLQAARELQSADPSAVTTADVQAIQAEHDVIKSRMR